MRRFLLVGALCAILGLTAAACKRPVPGSGYGTCTAAGCAAAATTAAAQASATATATAGAADRRSDLRAEDGRSAER